VKIGLKRSSVRSEEKRMEIKHTFEGDHYLFTEEDAPERSTGWVDGWRVELQSCDPADALVEFFDAEKNELFDCSVVPGSDLDREIDELVLG
jgi:hypothetical protein